MDKPIGCDYPQVDGRPDDFDERLNINRARIKEIPGVIEEYARTIKRLEEESEFLEKECLTIKQVKQGGIYGNFREWQIGQWIQEQQKILQQRKKSLKKAQEQELEDVLRKVENKYSEWWKKAKLVDGETKIDGTPLYQNMDLSLTVSTMEHEKAMRFLLTISDLMVWS